VITEEKGMRGRTRVIVIVAAVLTVLVVAFVVFGAGGPVAGSPAPGFTLTRQDGRPASLQDYRGKWVVLYFYPANSEIGMRQAQSFQRDLPKYAEAGAAVIGVTVEATSSNQEFATRAGLSYALLSDPGTKVASDYDSTQFSHMAILPSRNTFLIGPDGRIARVFLKVNPDRNSAEVLQALASLQK
jgi:thioredoxin-dependent peroxiredoxin